MPINKNKLKPRSDCKVINPVTGNIVDLTPFKNKGDIKVPDGHGGYFMLSVCSAFQSQSCMYNFMICDYSCTYPNTLQGYSVGYSINSFDEYLIEYFVISWVR